MHPSGGLIYHLRAWRWRRSLWAPFHDQVRRWLTDWRPETAHLVLVGPSGGYALSSQFLERFRKLTVLEPDALARRILVRRFPESRFEREDAPWLVTPEGFRRLAERYPEAAFLFCNLLGQVPAGAPADFDHRAWLESLDTGLAGRPWASWHDLASTARSPDRHGPSGAAAAESLDAALERYWTGGELEIHDHGCAGLCPGRPRQYAVWQLTPRRHHLIEWLCSGECPAAGSPEAGEPPARVPV
jgi:hypothetical protein